MTTQTLSYQSLRDQGLSLIEQLSSHVWTEYNISDPGITQLEHLCYGITDVLFRLNHPLEDLLADPGFAGLGADYPAESILPVRPLTILDLRKLLIDLPRVRNAWFDLAMLQDPPIFVDCDNEVLTLDENQAEGRIHPRGFYRVWIDCEEDVAEADEQAVLDEASALLHAHRNLCEDILSVEKVKIEDVGVCAEIEVAQEADLEQVHAEIIYALESFIAPRPRFYTLNERRELGLSSEDVLDGPLLEHGFLDDGELIASERYAELHVSDLIQLMMDVPGVLAVKNVSVSSYRDGVRIHAGERWVLPLDPTRSARLALTIDDNGSEKKVTRLLFFKAGVPFVANEDEMLALLTELRAADRHGRDIDNEAVYEVPEGDWPDPAAYLSVQNEFPFNYGIGPHGLPASATARRHAQARQLKAYLLLFEQFLANAQAQLAAARRMFSLADLDQTFYAQLTDDVAGLNDLLLKTRDNTLTYLHTIGESEAQFFKRRHRFLDHLLARVGERFNDYALIARRLHGNKADRQLLRDKTRLLENYPFLSANRAAAMDYTQTDRSFSGLEHYLKTLLGSLTDFFEIYFNAGESKYRWRLVNPEGGVLLYGTKPFASHAEAETAIEAVATVMNKPGSYDHKQNNATKWLAFLIKDGQNIARVPGTFDTEPELEDAIASVLTFYADYPPAKRLVLIEHILLRPRPGTTEFLPTCVQTQSGDCCGEDPYGFRLSIYLPYWLLHFRNMAFRRFIEQTIRERLPAHLFAKICWIGREEMDDLEPKYETWRKALAQQTPNLAAAQDALIACMADLRSRFPLATLHDCVEGEDENPIVLGNATLGTFKPEED